MRSIRSFGRREVSSRSIGSDTLTIGCPGRDGDCCDATEDRQRGIREFDATHGWRFPLDQKHRGKFFGLRHEYPSVLLTKGKRQPKSVVLLHPVETTHCVCQIFGRSRRLHRVFGDSFVRYIICNMRANGLRFSSAGRYHVLLRRAMRDPASLSAGRLAAIGLPIRLTSV